MLRKQAGIRRLRGKLDWEGDLEAMRTASLAGSHGGITTVCSGCIVSSACNIASTRGNKSSI